MSLYTVKFRKLAPQFLFFKGPFGGAHFWRGLSTEGNLRVKIDWASVFVDVNLLFLLCFSLYFQEGNFPSTSPRGLIFGGAI